MTARRCPSRPTHRATRRCCCSGGGPSNAVTCPALRRRCAARQLSRTAPAQCNPALNLPLLMMPISIGRSRGHDLWLQWQHSALDLPSLTLQDMSLHKTADAVMSCCHCMQSRARTV